MSSPGEVADTLDVVFINSTRLPQAPGKEVGEICSSSPAVFPVTFHLLSVEKIRLGNVHKHPAQFFAHESDFPQ